MGVLGLFTWWREATWGTKLQTWYRGEEVGVDGFGNRYYLEKGREGRSARRWVMYNGDIEASKVPPQWHAWLHKTVDVVPVDQGRDDSKSWVQPHNANVTGTDQAYYPPGHPSLGGKRAAASAYYEPWQPS